MSDWNKKALAHKGSFSVFEKSSKDYGWVYFTLFMVLKGGALPLRLLYRRPKTIGTHHLGFASVMVAYILLLIWAGLPIRESSGDFFNEGEFQIKSYFLWCVLFVFSLKLGIKLVSMVSQDDKVHPEESGVSHIAEAVSAKFFAGKSKEGFKSQHYELMGQGESEITIPAGLQNFIRIGAEPILATVLGKILHATIDPAAGTYLIFSGICLAISEIRTLQYVIALNEWKGANR